jgi:hypothetical protein
MTTNVVAFVLAAFMEIAASRTGSGFGAGHQLLSLCSAPPASSGSRPLSPGSMRRLRVAHTRRTVESTLPLR